MTKLRFDGFLAPHHPVVTMPVQVGGLVKLVMEVMERAPEKSLSTAEIYVQLPGREDIQQRQVYNLPYRRAATVATFLSIGEGKFTHRGLHAPAAEESTIR